MIKIQSSKSVIVPIFPSDWMSRETYNRCLGALADFENVAAIEFDGYDWLNCWDNRSLDPDDEFINGVYQEPAIVSLCDCNYEGVMPDGSEIPQGYQKNGWVHQLQTGFMPGSKIVFAVNAHWGGGYNYEYGVWESDVEFETRIIEIIKPPDDRAQAEALCKEKGGILL